MSLKQRSLILRGNCSKNNRECCFIRFYFLYVWIALANSRIKRESISFSICLLEVSARCKRQWQCQICVSNGFIFCERCHFRVCRLSSQMRAKPSSMFFIPQHAVGRLFRHTREIAKWVLKTRPCIMYSPILSAIKYIWNNTLILHIKCEKVRTIHKLTYIIKYI